MNYENFKFTTEEIEEGFIVTIKGDKDKLRTKLEAFEAFLNFKEKAKQARVDLHDSDSPFHQFIKSMQQHHGRHGEHPFKHRHSSKSYREDGPIDQNEENEIAKE